jgi:hypothetical protein
MASGYVFVKGCPSRELFGLSLLFFRLLAQLFFTFSFCFRLLARFCFMFSFFFHLSLLLFCALPPLPCLFELLEQSFVVGCAATGHCG